MTSISSTKRTLRGFFGGHLQSCIGIMEKKMETTIVYWGYIGILEKKMEATIVYYDLGFLSSLPTSSYAAPL